MGYIVVFLIGVIFVLFITIMIVMNFYRNSSSPRAAAVKENTSITRVDDLAAFVRQHRHCVVMIHAEWCTHCQKLAPILSKVAAQQPAGKMVFGKLDGPNHAQVLDAYNVQGFPTLLRFYNGNKIAEIRGMQTEDALKKFVKL